LFDYGLDDVFTNLNFLKEFQKGGSEEEGDKKAEGNKKADRKVTFNNESKTLVSMLEYVEKNNLEHLLREEVVKVWNTIYAPTVRKQRIWDGK